MPMIEIIGLENDTPQAVLEKLQEEIETALANGLEVEKSKCHAEPNISPIKRKRTKVFVWGRITTAFFWDKPQHPDSERRVKAATEATANKIWELLCGEVSVEIFPPPYMNQMTLKTLVKRRTS